MSFTVKATYGGETRKLVFDNPSFPSYEQLYNQLYKVFPSSNSYYLTRLLFSPTSSFERILLGMEARCAEEYNIHIAPYQGRQWPGALLRVTVCDETPHKAARRGDASNRASMAFSVDSELSAATMTTGGASTATAVEGNAPSRNEDDLSEFLDRLLHETHTRPSPTPSSNPFLRRSERVCETPNPPSMASTSRDTASTSRPLPETPATDHRSSTSAASTVTARPSLFELLSENPKLDRTHRLSSPLTQRRHETRQEMSEDPDHFDLTMSLMEALRRWDVPDRRSRRVSALPSPPRDGDTVSRLHRLSLNPRDVRDGVVEATAQEARPPVPPAGFRYRLPSLRPYAPRTPASKQPEAEAALFEVPVDQMPRNERTRTVPRRSVTITRSQHMSPQPVEAPSTEAPVDVPQDPIPDPSVQPEPEPEVVQEARDEPKKHCCSVAQGKAEVQVLITKFMADFEDSMKRAFGDDWATVRGCTHTDALRDTSEAMEKQLREVATTAAAEQVDEAARGPAPPSRESRWGHPRCNVAPIPGISRRMHHCGHSKPGARSPPRHPESYTAWLRDRLSRDGRTGAPSPREGPVPSGVPEPISAPFVVPPPPPPPLPTYAPSLPFWSAPESWSMLPHMPPPPPPPPSFLPYQPPEVRSSQWAGWAATPPPPVLSYPSAPRNAGPVPTLERERNASTTAPRSAEPESSPHHVTAAMHFGITCDACRKRGFTGVRFKCLDCQDFDLCGDCMSSPAMRGHHSFRHEFFPVDKPNDLTAYTRARSTRLPFSAPLHSSVTCDACGEYGIVGVRHKCLVCEDFDLCTNCLSSSLARANHAASHPFFPVEHPGDLSSYVQARDEHFRSVAPPVAPAPVSTPATPVHRNIICDHCDMEIVGVRHKCLDCPDFDLCSQCIASPDVRTAHDANHQFFEIEQPGHVYVHTVFTGDGERAPGTDASQHRNPKNSGVVSTPSPIPQGATCNLCDSYILGDRYKCLNCPDFDTCSSCFSITPEQHPEHGFVKITAPGDLQVRNGLRRNVLHYATCDICRKRINGVRYKCMHKSCPDFDLCQDCEAFPVPMHPPSHPLLKLKTADAVIPAVHDRQDVAPAPALIGDSFGLSTPQRRPRVTVEDVSDVEFPARAPLSETLPYTLAVISEVPKDPARPETPEQLVEQPEIKLIDIEDGPQVLSEQNEVTTTLDGFTTPSEAPTSSESTTSIPRLGPVNNDWREFWPEMTSVLKHLLQPTSPGVGLDVPQNAEDMAIPGAMREVARNAEQGGSSTLYQGFPHPITLESPLIGEALLSRPSEVTNASRPVTVEEVGRLLSDLTIRSTTAKNRSPPVLPKIVEPPKLVNSAPLDLPLTATFISDVNVPDGQVFPPGAEFVKSWKMKNNGTRDWPESTELVYVAGNRMPSGENSQMRVNVGAVPVDAEVEIVAGEMKAPEDPGRYISYWRLTDGNGNFFGHSVWVEINVIEMQLSTENSSVDESMASSSIIMPHSAPERSSVGSNPLGQAPNSASTLSCSIPSAPASEAGSLGSVPSLVELEVSSPTLSDDEIYEDSRSEVFVSAPTQTRRVQDRPRRKMSSSHLHNHGRYLSRRRSVCCDVLSMLQDHFLSSIVSCTSS
ncbi:hypothetical protein CERSUDRAFT_118662, partial [Gelatoporia subvermispora B]